MVRMEEKTTPRDLLVDPGLYTRLYICVISTIHACIARAFLFLTCMHAKGQRMLAFSSFDKTIY